jgi:hypothetical protein
MAVAQQKVEIKQKPEIKKKQLPELFAKENYTWMIIGAAIVALGMFLMSGGKNPNPNTFDYNVVYSTTRITVAPILIVAGLLIEVYAIFKRPKQSPNNAA